MLCWPEKWMGSRISWVHDYSSLFDNWKLFTAAWNCWHIWVLLVGLDFLTSISLPQFIHCYKVNLYHSTYHLKCLFEFMLKPKIFFIGYHSLPCIYIWILVYDCKISLSTKGYKPFYYSLIILTRIITESNKNIKIKLIKRWVFEIKFEILNLCTSSCDVHLKKFLILAKSVHKDYFVLLCFCFKYVYLLFRVVYFLFLFKGNFVLKVRVVYYVLKNNLTIPKRGLRIEKFWTLLLYIEFMIIEPAKLIYIRVFFISHTNYKVKLFFLIKVNS